MKLTTHGNESEQSDPPKSRIGRFLMVSFFAATSVIAGVRPLGGAGLFLQDKV